mmetsp:Transcript_17421/g.26130  ORF Transcript_17421/g.26130 Transcript_17421/m.26130 type:complete len:220 (+) Transcript_17421:84-743(+)
MRWAILNPIFTMMTLVCVLVLLTCDLGWANNKGTIGLYEVEFTAKLTGWTFKYNCKDGGSCPVDAHEENAAYNSDSCRWEFCKPCNQATRQMQALLRGCLAFVIVHLVLTIIWLRLGNRGGFLGKMIAVFVALLTLATVLSSWVVWLSKCNKHFDGMSYMIGKIHVINVKMQLHYAFAVAILGSLTALCLTATEVIRKSFNSRDVAPRNLVDGVNYALL